MSGRDRRSRAYSASSNISDAKLADLISKLKHHIPEIRHVKKVSASMVLDETCKHIRSLNREVDNLSRRLHEILSSGELDSDQIRVITSWME